MAEEGITGVRNFVINAIAAQFRDGNSNVDSGPIIETVLADEAMTRRAVAFAVEKICVSYVNKAIRRTVLHQEQEPHQNASGARLIAAITEYGLSLLDVKFGTKRLGDYLPSEAVAYASHQHKSARKMAITARFMASIAKACGDAMKPIREQLTDAQVEQIRRATIDTSPNKDVAADVLAVA